MVSCHSSYYRLLRANASIFSFDGAFMGTPFEIDEASAAGQWGGVRSVYELLAVRLFVACPDFRTQHARYMNLFIFFFSFNTQRTQVDDTYNI